MDIPGGHKKHRGVAQSTKGKDRLHKGYVHSNDIASQLMNEKQEPSTNPGLFARLFAFIYGRD